VQQEFNMVIDAFPLLAIYITLLAATSGNVGTQSAGIMIRAILTDQTDNRKLVKIFLSEVLLGLLVAATLAAAACAMVFLRGADADTLKGLTIPGVALVLGLSMVAAIITSNTLGALIPLIMRRLKIDPAVTAGPFITTAADILTILIYFNVAQALVLR
jgi:magnesium transporter